MTTPPTPQEAPPDAVARELKRIADTLERGAVALDLICQELVDARRREALRKR